MSNQIAPRRATVKENLVHIQNRTLTNDQRINSVRDVLEACKDSMFAALPKHITAERLIRVSLNCIRHTPKLLNCSPESLFSAITECATLGLEPNGVLGHAYLVPYGAECVLVPGYKGLIDLARRSATISTVTAEAVYEGDDFAYQLGDDPFIRHFPNDSDKDRHTKEVTHVYCVVKLRDGGIQRRVWSRSMIDAHKEAFSQGWRWAEHGDKKKGGGKKDSPWHLNFVKMAKKTVIRDMINSGEIPMSVEVQAVTNREEAFERNAARIVEGPPPVLSLSAMSAAIEGSYDNNDGDGGEEPQSDDGGEAASGVDWLTECRGSFELATTTKAVDEVEKMYLLEHPGADDRRDIEMFAEEARGRIKEKK